MAQVYHEEIKQALNPSDIREIVYKLRKQIKVLSDDLAPLIFRENYEFVPDPQIDHDIFNYLWFESPLYRQLVIQMLLQHLLVIDGNLSKNHIEDSIIEKYNNRLKDNRAFDILCSVLGYIYEKYYMAIRRSGRTHEEALVKGICEMPKLDSSKNKTLNDAYRNYIKRAYIDKLRTKNLLLETLPITETGIIDIMQEYMNNIPRVTNDESSNMRLVNDYYPLPWPENKLLKSKMHFRRSRRNKPKKSR